MASPSISVSASVFVRAAELDDAAGLHAACWPGRSLDSVAGLLEQAQRLAARRLGQGAVAVREGAPCGFGLLTIWPHAAEITDLIVTPDYRSQGIGSHIIGYLTGIAQQLKVDALEIGVKLTNPRALALYRRLGFADSRAVELDFGSGLETVLYLNKVLVSAGHLADGSPWYSSRTRGSSGSG